VTRSYCIGKKEMFFVKKALKTVAIAGAPDRT